VIEYAGSTIRAMPVEGRLTICNMSIEAGGRAGMIAPDDTTFEWLAGKPFARPAPQWDDRCATGARCRPTPARRSIAKSRSMPRDRADGHVGQQSRECAADLRPHPDPATVRRVATRSDAAHARATWDSTPGTR
jgi:3-isopropylmalate/(R)-2-methylmalate dehydratase large subunit